MKILVVGSGGREHALVWKIAQNKKVKQIFCAPGNAGISKLATCLDIKSEDIDSLLEFALKNKIDLTVVGPEAPLSLGIVDVFTKNKLKIFGPNGSASQLEASKIFAKELMRKYKIPTAEFEVFSSITLAKRYIQQKNCPLVIKADGLAAGKGVIVAKSSEEANGAVDLILQDRIFGSAGNKIVIEECLEGEEVSIIVITDSKTVLALSTSQDHKRIFDNDCGANTGGMGAYSPAGIVTEQFLEEILRKIIRPTIESLSKEKIVYKGVLYAGIMITKEGPKVLEFNVRFGDPETQAILPRLKSDLVEVMNSCVAGKLDSIELKWDSRACVCVVLASGGYPGDYKKGKEIFGLDEIEDMPGVAVFHAGTKKLFEENKWKIVTNGGRVLGVAGLGNTIKDAIDKTYEAVEKISFEGMHYRTDIAAKAISKLQVTNDKSQNKSKIQMSFVF